MRKPFLHFILLISFAEVYSQPITFIKEYHFGSVLFGEAIQTHDGEYAIICRTDSELMLIKSNSYGDTLWTKSYSTNYFSWPERLVEKNGGGFFILTGLQCGVYYCGTLLNVDAGGNFLWSHTYNSNYSTSFKKIILDSSNNIYLAGSTIYGIDSDYDEVLMKLDSNGNVLFQKTFVKGSHDLITSFRLSESKDYYFMSMCDSGENATVGYIRITRADSNGNIMWSTKIDTSGNASLFVSSMELSAGDDVYAVLKKANSMSQYPFTVVKIDSSGNLVWMKSYYTSYYFARGAGITKSASGSLAITGGIVDTANNSNDQQVFFLRIDSSGNILSSVLYPEEFSGCSIYSTYDGGYIISADDYSNAAGDSIGFYLIKTNENGEITGGTEFPSQENELKIFPNPSNGIFTVIASNKLTSNFQVEIFNALGLKVQTTSIQHNYSAEIDLNSFPSGIYIARMQSENSSFQKLLVLSK